MTDIELEEHFEITWSRNGGEHIEVEVFVTELGDGTEMLMVTNDWLNEHDELTVDPNGEAKQEGLAEYAWNEIDKTEVEMDDLTGHPRIVEVEYDG